MSVVEAPVAIEHGEFIGYASTWLDRGGADRQGDVVQWGAWSRTVEDINAGRVSIPVVLEHSWDDPLRAIGRVVEAREDDRGLWVRASLTSDAIAQGLRAKLVSGARLGLSVGYRVLRSRPVLLASGAKGRQLDELDLLHLAVTLTPANGSAFVTAAKSGPVGAVAGLGYRAAGYADIVSPGEAARQDAVRRRPVNDTVRMADALLDSGAWPAGMNFSLDTKRALVLRCLTLRDERQRREAGPTEPDRERVRWEARQADAVERRQVEDAYRAKALSGDGCGVCSRCVSYMPERCVFLPDVR